MIKPRLNLSKFPLQKIETNLIEAQIVSYKWLLDYGLKDLFEEVSPIEDYSSNSWSVSFGNVRIGDPNSTFIHAQHTGGSYDAPVYIVVYLKNLKSGEIKEQEIYLMDVPLMSDRGTFMVNGNERVIVQQVVRAEGVIFLEQKVPATNNKVYQVKVIPQKGKWYTFEASKTGILSVRLLDGRPKIYLTTILKALGYSGDKIRDMYSETSGDVINYIENTLSKDTTSTKEEALVDIFTKLRPEDSVNLKSAEALFNSLFFSKRRFFLGKTGRFQINKKVHKIKSENISEAEYLLNKKDIIEIIRGLIDLANGRRLVDDVDHLSNRRLRGIGELIHEKLRVGALRMEKNIKDRMSTFSTDELLTPSLLINTRPISTAVLQFFASSEVSRYMDQENPLSELEVKRRITAGGPGGLSKESASFSVRDVHFSQYSKWDPVATPEGPSIGIVTHMAMYARVNEYGFLEAPYRKVLSGEEMIANKLKLKDGTSPIKDKMYVTDKIEYLSSDEEMEYIIAHAGINIGHNKVINEDVAFCRYQGNYVNVDTNKIQYIDLNPSQIAGLGLSLIPFSANTDTLRTLMASNMQRQAVPLVKAKSAIVGTGIERVIGKASGRCVYAEDNGVVQYVDAKKIIVKYDKPVSITSDIIDFKFTTNKKVKDVLDTNAKQAQDTITYDLNKFYRTNQDTCFDQLPVVKMGDKVSKGDLLIQGPAMEGDELALGTNLRVAYLPWNGYNYEDGIILSERVVKEDLLTSIHIKEYVQDIRETKLGPEEITADIPGASDYLLRNLNEDGVVTVGAKVSSGDILVGIVAPKGETELSAEEKLLRIVFGEAAKDVRDNSLRMPHGDKGVVIDVQLFDKKKGDKLDSGVLKQVKVYVARTHKVGVGDKLTGRYGDKGIVTKILPIEDMPYTKEGEIVDIILSPLSIVKRMNLGQLKETHIGEMASKLGIKVEVPPFAPLDETKITDLVEKEGVNYSEKVDLYDGQTGEKYAEKVVVGVRHILKLNHLAEDKIHARSDGPYTIVTQQPLGGKAQFGGQRFGEMEVWAIEAHGAPTILQELLSTKSDSMEGREMAHQAIVNGENPTNPQGSEATKVLFVELQSLGISPKLNYVETPEDELKPDENQTKNDVISLD